LVDGLLVRRNAGTQKHGRLQLIVGSHLQGFEDTHRLIAFIETRLLVNPDIARYRVPDVMAVEDPVTEGRAVVDVPVIVVEIQSPDDTFAEILERCIEYERLGVPNIVMMDPETERVWFFEDGNFRQSTGESITLNLRRGPITLPIAKMFAKIRREHP
jgi:Uma2 family endonuclease